MDAVSYPDKKVSDFIDENMVPLRLSYVAKPYAADFNVKWTPTVVTLDTQGKEHHRTVGFLSPDELIASLTLGMGKSAFDNENYDEAIGLFDRVLDEYPKSDSAPESIYLRGVSLFKKTDDPAHLKQAGARLTAEYPKNEWARRAKPYELL